MRIIGASFGDPNSSFTYSGVPFALFNELEGQGYLVDRIDIDLGSVADSFSDYIDINRSFKHKRPKKNKYWRYLPNSINKLSKRYRRLERNKASHDTVLQIGVAGLPDPTKLVFAHVEISIQTAANLPGFSETYGFNESKEKYLAKASEGERLFMEKCDIIWTNSEWTYQTFAHHNLPREKFFIHPPVANIADPGDIDRNWNDKNILFIGKDWERKGGPQLVDAFQKLRQKYTDAHLTIIGCDPKVEDTRGITIHDYLDKNIPQDRAVIEQAFRSATIFCMPSKWESTGIVYMEAALYGLPLIMCSGQGREQIFPEAFAKILPEPNPQNLYTTLDRFLSEPSALKEMGQCARKHALQNFTWNTLARKIVDRIQTAGEQRALNLDAASG